MNADETSAARARQLLHMQRLLEEAQRRLLMLPDVAPDGKEAMKKTHVRAEKGRTAYEGWTPTRQGRVGVEVSEYVGYRG